MNCYLIDTCALLWAAGFPNRLSSSVREILADGNNRILVSHSTLWELSIKVTIGKLNIPEEFFNELPNHGYEILPITEQHLRAYRSLPLHHRDPFDRLLIAQALAEEIPLITNDSEIQKYTVQTVW